MNKAERIKAVEALVAELKKTPEDKVLEKLDEILKAIQALPHYYPSVCPYHHYPYPYITYPQITWTSPTVTTGTISSAGSYTILPNAGVTYTNASGGEM